ncbi:phosphoesterase [Metallosphaera sedula]|uniref:Phosphoesterase n=5 Tax=Metallosphaera TaxID=41980 RepID=A4YFH6_METS5|nr:MULTISPECIES: alkaline phosphatase family protein [Metallosphaera]ABP95178.1 phosphoesterase [Metallosphaera sedula DSM 5348]AIM27164.1 phosphoesterase [Metallosphaera sedula]AKV74066.1 acid phosphatase [Metallosphaera sedula]AKV76306.1 acid phosphatase [Metallosphaera sedula]AKV78557.1 acid phosphatase [Metallosphaera sedula]
MKALTWIGIVLTLLSALSFLSIVSSGATQATATPIKHVIFIELENHAFDSIYGTYPFGYPVIVNNITMSVMRPVNYIYNLSLLNTLSQSHGNVTWISVPAGKGYLHPYYANSTVLVNPKEGYTNYHEDWNWGQMNGFVNGSGPQSLAYVSYEQVPLLWDYAEEYVLFDNYFSPTLSVTVPNRIAYITGFPTQVESDAPQFGLIPLNESILYQLTENNVSWGWYEYGYSKDFQILSPDLYLGYNNTAPLPVSLLKGANQWNSHYHDLSDFLAEARNGSLPSVSYVMFTGPMGYDDHVPGYDMHPPYNTTLAMLMLSTVINAVMTGPDWNSTVIFITFDEGGGYYDPVPPPIVNGFGLANTPTISKILPGYFTLGQRIPLLMVSPYSKEGFVDNYTASGYSILAFIDYNWHLPYLNPIVKEFGPESILYGLNFTAPRPPLVLTPENWSYPVPLQYPIHYGYVATINNNYSIYNAIYHDKQMGNYTPPQYFLEGNVVQGGVQEATGSSAGFPTLLLWIPVLLIIIAVGVLLERRK